MARAGYRSVKGAPIERGPSLCLRCGQCCHYEKPKISRNGESTASAEPRIKRCRYLAYGRDGRAYCRIYSRRLGQSIGDGFYCVARESDKRLFLTCPYNDAISRKWGEEAGLCRVPSAQAARVVALLLDGSTKQKPQ